MLNNEEIIVADGGCRIDSYLATQLPELSRSRLQQLLKAGEVLVNGKPVKPRYILSIGEVITLTIPAPVAPLDVTAEDIPLEIVFQDADLLVINKAAGLVVHPGAGNWHGTLVNALLHHVDDLSGIGGELRPGIVHRLDKDTSGLMLVAKHDRAHRALAEMIQLRKVKREYIALAWGSFAEAAFTVNAPIGRHPSERTRMAVLNGENDNHMRRHAITHFKVTEQMPHAAALTATLDTGRTHQIRVHLHYLGHPVVGDPLYGEKIARKHQMLLPSHTIAVLSGLPGQALHAFRLSFPHPTTGEALSFEAVPPDYFINAWQALRAEA